MEDGYKEQVTHGGMHRTRTATILSAISAVFWRKDSSTVTLSRRLGLGSTVSLLLGIMIGTGIFISPKGVLEYSGSFGASLIVWFLCGVIATIGKQIHSIFLNPRSLC